MQAARRFRYQRCWRFARTGCAGDTQQLAGSARQGERGASLGPQRGAPGSAPLRGTGRRRLRRTRQRAKARPTLPHATQSPRPSISAAGPRGSTHSPRQVRGLGQVRGSVPRAPTCLSQFWASLLEESSHRQIRALGTLILRASWPLRSRASRRRGPWVALPLAQRAGKLDVTCKAFAKRCVFRRRSYLGFVRVALQSNLCPVPNLPP
mgnify:CR=1 FL=1|jgi:hypothetical protein